VKKKKPAPEDAGAGGRSNRVSLRLRREEPNKHQPRHFTTGVSQPEDGTVTFRQQII
jgi:hypothetical protein